jgi:Fe-S oxidoreductase
MTFALWEQGLLAALVAATLIVTGRALLAKWRLLEGAGTDRPRTDHPASRLARVVREVLFQSRVISGRPVVGTLHAMVFFGFLCFGLETVDHFLEPYHLPLLQFLFGAGGKAVFETVVAVVAVIVMIGISGLAWRRFVMVNSSPDPKSWTSGLVALLILLLMATYLYGLADITPPAAKTNWWVHALIIIVFPPLILHSKHFHILTAPFNVFFRNERLGDYLPLELDPEKLGESEDEITLGLETMKDTPWKMRLDFLSCVECRRCTDHCPAASSGLELKPREFILAGRRMLGTEEPLIGNVFSETALGQCTSCGACENICPVGVEHTQVLMGAKRAQALAIGQGMVAADYLETVERYGNPFSEPRKTRQRVLDEVGIPLYEPGKTDYLLWLGCVWTFNADARSSLESMIAVLNRAGVSYGVLKEESCSGHHSRRQGEEMQFQTLAGENIERFRANGVTRMVSPCPHCLHTIAREYPTVDAAFSVDAIHHSTLMRSLVQSGRLATSGNVVNGARVTYHDPCYLGRYENVYDAPRELIAAHTDDFVELPRHRARSFCCGGGSAGFARTQEDTANRPDKERKREIVGSGANVLVTGCPECKMMLDATVEQTMDIAEFVDRASRGDTAKA